MVILAVERWEFEFKPDNPVFGVLPLTRSAVKKGAVMIAASRRSGRPARGAIGGVAWGSSAWRKDSSSALNARAETMIAIPGADNRAGALSM